MVAVRALALYFVLVATGAALADSTAYTTVEELSVEAGPYRFSQKLLLEGEGSDSKLRSVPVNPFLLSHRPIFVDLEDADSGDLIFRRFAPNLSHLWVDPDFRFFVGLSNVKLNNRVQIVVYDQKGRLIHSEHISPFGACQSTEQWNEFQLRYRESADFLIASRMVVRSGYFVDFERMGMPDKLGGGAWDHLSQHRCHSPYSNRFDESVSNFVLWFDQGNPELELVYGDGEAPLGLLIKEREWPRCERNLPEFRAQCERSSRRFLVRFRSVTR